MKTKQKGFVIPLIIIIILLIIGGGIYIYTNKESLKIPKKDTSETTEVISTSTTGTKLDTTSTTSVVVKPKLPNTSTSSINYNSKPISECAECGQNGNPSNMTCCTATFAKECTAKGGVIRWRDGHPGPYSSFNACYQKAPDTGKSCGVAENCLSGTCNLEVATSSGKCTLINKILTGERGRFGGQEFFTATYSCNTTKPGVCMEAVNNVINPGGVFHTFKMEDKKLIETLESGPIF